MIKLKSTDITTSGRNYMNIVVIDGQGGQLITSLKMNFQNIMIMAVGIN